MKNFTLLILMAIAMVLPAQADNYLTVGENGTFRINPCYLGSAYSIPVRAHFDGLVDQWDLTVRISPELEIISMTKGSGMSITYCDINGDTTATFSAPFNVGFVNDTTRTVASNITDYGYWDYNHDGILEPYGTIKWEAGDYDCMFKIHVLIDQDFTGGHIVIYGYIDTSDDTRGGTIQPAPQAFYDYVYVVLGYKKGDVSGDEHINMTDVTMLVNYVMSETGFDDYQLEAADVNGDGYINLTDITLLTNMVMSGINYVPDELVEE